VIGPPAQCSGIVAGDATGRNMRGAIMPRYLVERSFPDGLDIPVNPKGAQSCLNVVGKNAEDGVTWIHSYVTPDKTKTFCIYDGSTPEAIRRVAQRNGLPVDRITEIRVLDPYFYM
jgi:Protein of unknown function (DUF4242)